MSIIRLKDKIPEVYTNTSRDFQLLTRLYDILINGVLTNSDVILNSINTDFCDSKLLNLLQTKIGFLSDAQINGEDVRQILKVFPDIIRHKGSLLGIESAVRAFFKINGITEKARVDVVNNKGYDKYIVYVYLPEICKDTTILDELFRYILPTGYMVRYCYYSTSGYVDQPLETRIGANIIVIKDSLNSLVRGNYISYNNNIENRLIGSVGLTQIATPYDLEYKGVVDNYSDLPNRIYEFMRGWVYLVKSSEDGKQFSAKNPKFTSWVCDYNENGELSWCVINGSGDLDPQDEDYPVYSNAVYGYKGNGEYDGFYENREGHFYEEDTSASGDFVVNISGSTTPENADISVAGNETITLFNVLNGIYYTNDGNSWVSSSFDDSGIEIKRYPGAGADIDYMGLVPKHNLIAFRGEVRNGKVVPSQANTAPAMWLPTYNGYEYSWGDIILSEEVMLSYYNDPTYTKVIILNSPYDAYVVPFSGGKLYNKTTRSFWYAVPDGSGFKWGENQYENVVYIKGTPSNAEILTDAGNGDTSYVPPIISGTKIWKANMEYTFTDPIELSVDALYIDRETFCAYDYRMNEVLHFVKAKEVYEIDYDDLLYMLENKTIKPAFKDDTVIFEDTFGNMLLL